jgi:hypothetical protein
MTNQELRKLAHMVVAKMAENVFYSYFEEQGQRA